MAVQDNSLDPLCNAHRTAALPSLGLGTKMDEFTAELQWAVDAATFYESTAQMDPGHWELRWAGVAIDWEVNTESSPVETVFDLRDGRARGYVRAREPPSTSRRRRTGLEESSAVLVRVLQRPR